MFDAAARLVGLANDDPNTARRLVAYLTKECANG